MAEESFSKDSGENTGQDVEGIFGRFKELLGRSKPREGKPQRFHVIINPAAGKDQPILKTLNAAFKVVGADWDVFVTKTAGDARRLAQEAVAAGADGVVVHGGDGTVMEAASGLVGSDVPLAIIPGGTANVMSRELGIPIDLVEACALAVNPEALTRKVDIGQIGDNHFLLRASMGFEASMVEGADRDLKDRIGVLAYMFSALQTLADPEIANYHLTLDGETVETQGLTCIIANSGALGTGEMKIAPDTDISDGLLDVFVVTKADLPSLLSLAGSVMGGVENTHALQHWQVKEVSVYSEPVQNIQLDGELIGQTPVLARILPGAVRFIVPPGQTAAEPDV